LQEALIRESKGASGQGGAATTKKVEIPGIKIPLFIPTAQEPLKKQES
jgi:hypothetical protein